MLLFKLEVRDRPTGDQGIVAYAKQAYLAASRDLFDLHMALLYSIGRWLIEPVLDKISNKKIKRKTCLFGEVKLIDSITI